MAPLSVLKHTLIVVGLLSQVFATPFLSDGDSHPLEAREPDLSGNDIGAWMQFFAKRSANPYNTSGATDGLERREKETLTEYYPKVEMWPLIYTKDDTEHHEAMRLVYLKSAFRVQLAAAPYRANNIGRTGLPRPIQCAEEHDHYCKEINALAKTQIIYIVKNEGKPKTTVIVVRSEELKKFFVIFRGTVNLKNKISDVRYWSTRVHQDNYGVELCAKCLIHKGFYLFAVQVLKQLDDLFCVSGAKDSGVKHPLLRDENYGDYDIEIIGHSLGAAAAQILTLIWRHRREHMLDNHCFWGRSIGNSNFGSPVVGNINFAENLAKSALKGDHPAPSGAKDAKGKAVEKATYKDFNHRWSHNWDPIPCLPPKTLPPIYKALVQVRRLWFEQDPEYVHAPPEIFIDTKKTIWQPITEENFPEYVSVQPNINEEMNRHLKVLYSQIKSQMNFHRNYIHGGDPGGISYGEDQGLTPEASRISNQALQELNGDDSPVEAVITREAELAEAAAKQQGKLDQQFPA